MARSGFTSETPAAVSKRMSDLILCFPSAAAGGVQWQTLVGKYNERHSTNLDIAALGHASPVAAATALLWDVLRVVDTVDSENPIVAIEDSVAMMAEPGASATWPSLYKSLCEIVSEHGSREEEGGGDGTASAILVSQLKPLLQRHWHSSFDECSLSYLTEQGKPVRVKKMKHLLQALLQWRSLRIAHQSTGRHSELDEAIEPELELVPSKKHNDLLLRCVSPMLSPSAVGSSSAVVQLKSGWPEQSPPSVDSESQSTSASTGGSADLLDEIALLRAENERLRSTNVTLEQRAQCHDEESHRDFCTEDFGEGLKDFLNIPLELIEDVWNNPSEPPPYEYCGSRATPSGSTVVPSSFGFGSGDVTPLTMASASHSHSVSEPPTTWVWDGQCGQLCSMVPMWYVIGDRGLHDVPSGVVRQGLSIFEKANEVLPSFFTMGNRDV